MFLQGCEDRMNRNLMLDLSLSREAFESSMNATYRKEGLSVGADHMVRCFSFSFMSHSMYYGREYTEKLSEYVSYDSLFILLDCTCFRWQFHFQT